MVIKRLSMLLFAVVCGALLAGCGITETDRAQKERAWSDKPATLTCYDYGNLVFEGRSTAKPQRSDTGEGMWEFIDASNNRFTQVEGSCVVSYD